MTIHAITSNSYPQKSSLKPIRVNGAVTGISNGQIHGALTPPSLPDITAPSPSNASAPLLTKFVEANKELASYRYVSEGVTLRGLTRDLGRDGKPITIDGHTLSIAAVTAAARFNAQVELTGSSTTRQNVEKSRAVIDGKIASGTSVYGVSTGFGGSGTQMSNFGNNHRE